MEKEVTEYSYQEILTIKEEPKRNELARTFQAIKEEIASENRITRRLVEEFYKDNIPLEILYEQVRAMKDCSISTLFFPNHFVLLYPKITEHKAKQTIFLHIGPRTIEPGETYCVYRPLIEDLTTKKRYTIKNSIKAECYAQDLFPQTFQELEQWEQNLEQAYNDNYNNLDFYDLSRRLGCDTITLLPLRNDAASRQLRYYKKQRKQLLEEEKRLLKALNRSLYLDSIQEQYLKNQKRQQQINQKLLSLPSKDTRQK